MKKILASLMALTAAASFGATALTESRLVYDFTASIKRIEPTYSVQKYGKTPQETVAFKYNVVSDTLKGYVLLPYCANCVDINKTASVRTMVEGTGGVIVVREGDKFGTIDGHKKASYDQKVLFKAAIFGANVAQNVSVAEGPQTIADCRYAWLSFAFNTPTTKEANLEVGKILPAFNGIKYTEDAGELAGQLVKLYYGFLGLNNSFGGIFEAAGFGEAVTKEETTAGTIGWCVSTEGSKSSCTIIKGIEGSILANPQYKATCGVQAMWDVCYVTSLAAVNDAVVCGTWKITLNSTITDASYKKGEEDMWEGIYKGLNIDKDDVETVDPIKYDDEEVKEVEEVLPAIN